MTRKTRKDTKKEMLFNKLKRLTYIKNEILSALRDSHLFKFLHLKYKKRKLKKNVQTRFFNKITIKIKGVKAIAKEHQVQD